MSATETAANVFSGGGLDKRDDNKYDIAKNGERVDTSFDEGVDPAIIQQVTEAFGPHGITVGNDTSNYSAHWNERVKAINEVLNSDIPAVKAYAQKYQATFKPGANWFTSGPAGQRLYKEQLDLQDQQFSDYKTGAGIFDPNYVAPDPNAPAPVDPLLTPFDTKSSFQKASDLGDLSVEHSKVGGPVIDTNAGAVNYADEPVIKAYKAALAAPYAVTHALAATNTAPTLSAADHLATVLANKTVIDQTKGTQDRGQQQDLVTRLIAASQGAGPSLAQNILTSGTNDALRKALSFAATTGGSAANAATQAASAQAGLNADAINQAAVQRVTDTLSARKELQDSLSGLRTQDDRIATDQASLDQGVELSNSTESNKNNQFGEGQKNTVGVADAANKVTVGEGNANRSTDVSKTNAAGDTTGAKDVYDTTNKVDQDFAGQQYAAGAGNAANKMTGLVTSANNKTTLTGTQAQTDVQTRGQQDQELNTGINTEYGITNTSNKDLQGGAQEAIARDQFAQQLNLSRDIFDQHVREWEASTKQSFWNSVLAGVNTAAGVAKLIGV